MGFNLKEIFSAADQQDVMDNENLPANFVEEVATVGLFGSFQGERVLILSGGCAGRFPCPSKDADVSIVPFDSPLEVELEVEEPVGVKERITRIMDYAVEANCKVSAALTLPCILLGSPDAFEQYPEAKSLGDIYDSALEQYEVNRVDIIKAKMFG